MKSPRDERITSSLHLQVKYRELHEQFHTLRQHFVLIECAWCQKRIRWQRKKHPSPGDTSHGICPRCFEAVSRELGGRGGSKGRMQTPERALTADLLPPYTLAERSRELWMRSLALRRRSQRNRTSRRVVRAKVVQCPKKGERQPR